MNTKQWRLEYDLNGGRGCVFISMPNESAAMRLFLARFPGARIVRVSEVRT